MYTRRHHSKVSYAGAMNANQAYHAKHRLARYKATARSSRKTMYAPTSIGSTMRTKAADSISCSNRENVFPVTVQESSDTYSVVGFAVQPGLSSLFPLLSRTAASYTRYKMRFNVEFVPSVGTIASGNILIAMDRNRNEGPPVGVSRFMSYAGAVQSSIWSPCVFPANKRMVPPSEKKLFTRYGSLLPGEDINLYDMATIFIGLSGINTGSGGITPGTTIGQIYINYECKLMDQRVEDIVDTNAFVYYPTFPSDGLVTIPNTSEAALPYALGGGDVQYTGSIAWGLGPSIPDTGCTLIFPTAGFYLIQQTMVAEFINGANATEDFAVYGFGRALALGEITVNPIWGDVGTGVILSDYINQAANTAPSSVAVASCLQIAQVLVSGTYLVGDNVVVGSGYISKGVGAEAYVPGDSASTNEVVIFTQENSGGSPAATAVLKNVYIEVTPIDLETAAYFFPETWQSNAVPGPMGTPMLKTIRHHQKGQCFQGIARHHMIKHVVDHTPKPSSSVVQVDKPKKEEDSFDEEEYDEYLEYKRMKKMGKKY
nr:MAG: putative capsid protein [Arizlama virus]